MEGGIHNYLDGDVELAIRACVVPRIVGVPPALTVSGDAVLHYVGAVVLDDDARRRQLAFNPSPLFHRKLMSREGSARPASDVGNVFRHDRLRDRTQVPPISVPRVMGVRFGYRFCSR